MAFFGLLCPNQGLIRTAWAIFWAFVSESGAHSDSLWPFLGFCVRIKGLFGQLRGFLGLLRPNQGLIRTDWGIFGAFVSESGAHSDRLGHFLGLCVRISGSFGQLGGSFGLSCLNQGLIQTA
jgi:hypothetical protein